MSRYHVGDAWGTWDCLKYPYFGFSVISALDALARLGYASKEPKIDTAVEYLLSRQLPDGTWPLDESWPRSPIEFGQVGEPNKWLTLDALRVLRLRSRVGTPGPQRRPIRQGRSFCRTARRCGRSPTASPTTASRPSSRPS